MTSSKRRVLQQPPVPLHPDRFYRLHEGPIYFGYGPGMLKSKIESGEIPPLTRLSDTGRARGWFGRVIIKWQQERQAKSSSQAAQPPEGKVKTRAAT